MKLVGTDTEYRKKIINLFYILVFSPLFSFLTNSAPKKKVSSQYFTHKRIKHNNNLL